MSVYDIIMKRRTIRKFEQKEIPYNDLLKLVDCARVAPYAKNLQPLKFVIIDDKEMLIKIFPYTKWAGYLQDGTPKEDERPTAYILVLGDRSIKSDGSFDTDAGTAVTTMSLAAWGMGIGSCWLGAIDREKIKELLNLDKRFEVCYLLALGYPKEESRMTEVKDGIKYFKDENKVINVSKRTLDEIIIKV